MRIYIYIYIHILYRAAVTRQSFHPSNVAREIGERHRRGAEARVIFLRRLRVRALGFGV